MGTRLPLETKNTRSLYPIKAQKIRRRFPSCMEPMSSCPIAAMTGDTPKYPTAMCDSPLRQMKRVEKRANSMTWVKRQKSSTSKKGSNITTRNCKKQLPPYNRFRQEARQPLLIVIGYLKAGRPTCRQMKQTLRRLNIRQNTEANTATKTSFPTSLKTKTIRPNRTTPISRRKMMTEKKSKEITTSSSPSKSARTTREP